MNLEDISEVIPYWRNKKDTYPSTIKVERAIEVHDPVLGSVGWDRSLHVGPFGDEIGDHLRLYRLAAPEINGVRAELYCPFNDLAIGFLIMEDVAQRILSNHCYLICLKVMTELPRHNKDSVQ